MTPDDVKKLRKDRGWNQQQLAAALGVDQATVSRIENGAEPSGPVALLLRRLADEPAPAAEQAA